jgi:c-di-GMP-binding flagellar brake protein YcgR
MIYIEIILNGNSAAINNHSLKGAKNIMILNKLAIGSKLSIINENKTTYEGIVRTVMGDNFIIQIKIAQPNYVSIKKGDNLEYLVGLDVEAYRCISTIQEININSQFTTIVLGNLEVISKIERRKYIRVQSVISISYYPIPENEHYETLNSVPHSYWKKIKNTFTMDISGGGISLIAYENNIPDQNVLIKFYLYEEIRLLARVVRSSIDENDNKFKLYLQFVDISPSHEKNIIDYVVKNIKIYGNNKIIDN